MVTRKLSHQQTTAANQEWALDFIHDVVAAGRSIRVLSVVDAHTRECLVLEVDTGFASRRVTRVLEEVIAQRGKPLAIRCDNGGFFIDMAFSDFGILKWPTLAVCFGPPWVKRTSSLDLSNELGSGGGSWT